MSIAGELRAGTYVAILRKAAKDGGSGDEPDDDKEGRQDEVEHERKFLLADKQPPTLPAPRHIIQGYWRSPHADISLRLIPAEEKAWWRIKSPPMGGERVKVKEKTPYAEAVRQIYEAPAVTVKDRFTFHDAGREWKVEHFDDGRKQVETELEHDEILQDKPDWVGDEATHDSQAYSAAHARPRSHAELAKLLSEASGKTDKSSGQDPWSTGDADMHEMDPPRIVERDELDKSADPLDWKAAGSQAEHSGSVMIAYFPTTGVARQLSMPDGEPAHELHVTLVYLGKIDELSGIGEERARAIIRQVLEQSTWEQPPLDGSLTGVGRFNVQETSMSKPDSKGRPIVALVDVPGLAAFRTRLVERLEQAGIPVHKDHDFTPHVTLKYEGLPPSGHQTPEAQPGLDLQAHGIPEIEDTPLSIDRLHLVWDNDREEFSLDRGIGQISGRRPGAN